MAQRDVVAVDLHRYARRGQRAAQHRQGAGAGADQDGHVAPGDAVLRWARRRMSATLSVSVACGGVGVRLDPAAGASAVRSRWARTAAAGGG
ncbi:hypothetical protein [Streptomyces thioluteus]|uniref:hypothetical protein n=1 Tax=Streptomyces thioluteus TaxID=66431 RepID=UPI0031E74D69